MGISRYHFAYTKQCCCPSLPARLINDILDFSRLEDGSLGLDLTTFQLPALLKEVRRRQNLADYDH